MNSKVLLLCLMLWISSVVGQTSLYNVVELNKYSNTSGAVIEKVTAQSVAECTVQCRRRAWCCSSVYSQATGKCGLLANAVPTQSTPIGWDGANSGGLVVVRPDQSIDQESDCCAEMPVQSIKYAYWTPLAIDTPDNGPITQITTNFTKTSNITDLRVTYSSDMRCLSGCCRFYLTYNNQECSNPVANDLIIFHAEGSKNIFWNGYIEGICRGIPSGTVSIRQNTGICPGYAAGNMYLGFKTGMRLMVEEMQLSKTSLPSPCLAQPNFNIQHFGINYGSEVDNGVAFTVNYHKRTSDSGLKLSFVGNIRATSSCSPTPMCTKWELLINGASCANPQPIEHRVYLYSLCGLAHYYTSPVSGICLGVPAGDLTIQVYVGNCAGYTSFADAYTGWNSVSHIIAEEVRTGTAFISPSATPVFNSQNLIQSMGGSSGLIMSMAYTKTRNDSSLRVSWSGTIYISTSISYAYCNYWYFTFNGLTCSSPGPIDSVFYIDGSSFANGISYYRTNKFFGLCRNSQASTITVGLNAGVCSGYTYGNPSTWSTGTMTVEEVLE